MSGYIEIHRDTLIPILERSMRAIEHERVAVVSRFYDGLARKSNRWRKWIPGVKLVTENDMRLAYYLTLNERIEEARAHATHSEDYQMMWEYYFAAKRGPTVWVSTKDYFKLEP